MSELAHHSRAAAGEPRGLLVLHHGRGTNEQDMLGLADALDPRRRLQVVAPRAPLTLAGSPGFHWYVIQRVGHPDAQTFHASYDALAALHDELWRTTGIGPASTVMGGFSMGAVMSYALGLAAPRPRPAGILALSGFIPDAPGWRPDLAARSGLPAFIGHGRFDPVIDVGFARAARDLLMEGGLRVDYQEFDGAHHVDPGELASATGWLERTLARGAGDGGVAGVVGSDS